MSSLFELVYRLHARVRHQPRDRWEGILEPSGGTPRRPLVAIVAAAVQLGFAAAVATVANAMRFMAVLLA
jgi:hypothetical protein